MILKQRLFSNMFLRNMLADFGNRSAYSRQPGKFIPYFQYKIEDYHSDLYLYFPKEPYTRRYHNEIFNKLCEYKGYDIITFLEFHYLAYCDKQDFLRFLQYELIDRLKQKTKESRRQKIYIASEWVMEKQQEHQSKRQEILKQEFEKEVREALPPETPVCREDIDNIAKALSEKFSNHIDQIITGAESKMKTLTDSYVVGKIELNNQTHEDKLIKFFKLLQSVKAPPQIAKAEQLFSKYSDTDIAAILWLHFEAFKNKKIETIPRNIRKADALISDKNPKAKQLADALQDFFYS
jgi:hypothetical protein